MSTLTPSGAGSMFSRHAASIQSNEQLPHHATLVPRSALRGVDDSTLENSVLHSSSFLDTRGIRRVEIDIPLGSQSSMSMEVTQNCKLIGVPTQRRMCLNTSRANALEVSTDSTRLSSMSTRCGSVLDAGTMRGPPSPRKPIPAQWLPERSAPNLATAQRAKERGHKKGSMSGSPVEGKMLRGTRSSVEMNKAYGSDGASFLTKDALTTVDSNMASPTSARSPTKQSRTTLKPAWHSPGATPLHESPRQHSSLSPRSPTKRLSLQNVSLGRRGPSSIATSTGESIFHSAEGSVFHSAEVSPVRSTADSELSFRTAEFLHPEDAQIPDLQLNADIEDEQVGQNSGTISITDDAATNRMTGLPKPKLAVDTSVSAQLIRASDTLSPSDLSATSASTASNSSWSATSANSSSRIPRAAAASLSSARGPTRSSTLKRTQSHKSLTSPKVTSPRNDSTVPHQTLQPSTPATASMRQVRTVNSSGRTPILTRRPTIQRIISSSVFPADSPTDTLPAHDTQTTLAQVTSSLNRLNIDQQQQLVSQCGDDTPMQSSRASSMCTVKATPNTADPAMEDATIVYCKKSGATGTILDRPIYNPPLIAMMAHNFDVGTIGVEEIPYPSKVPSSDFSVNGSGGATSAGHPRAESEHSLRSSQSSDLRATATEFVPKTVTPETSEITAKPPLDPTADLLGDQKFELDQHGIPWFWYMYQVQFAYEQGFNNGRTRSPKKHRGNNNKKHRTTTTSPTDGQSSQHCVTEMLPPASTVSLAEQRAQQERANASDEVASPTDTSTADRQFSPFSAQKDAIARSIGINAPRSPYVDLTTIRNVPSYTGHYGYNNIPNRGAHYNNNNRRNHHHSDNGLYNYAGRGFVGVPMHNTVPFPNPTPPQGRPTGGENGNPRSMAPVPDYRNAVGSEACGVVDIVNAGERIGGEACNKCEPDHPLE